MSNDIPMYIVFSHTDPNIKKMFNDLYKNTVIKDYNLQHQREFNSKDYFQQKFGNDLLKTQQLKEILQNIFESFEKISKTKVFDNGNLEMSLEGEKLNLNLHLIEKSKYDFNRNWRLSGKRSLFLNGKLSFLCRTPFHKMDYHKFQVFHGVFEENNSKGFRFASSFPFVFNTNTRLMFELLQKQKYIDLNIEEHTLAQKIRILHLDKTWSAYFKHKYLQNHLNIKKSSQYCLDNQIFPSNEYSLKFKRTFFDTLEKGIIDVGKKAHGSVMFGYNDNFSNYMKVNYKLKKYFQLFNPETQNHPSLRYINIENCLKIGAYIPFTKNNKKENLINNLLDLDNRIPGFKNIGSRYPKWDNFLKEGGGDSTRSQFFLINTIKINFYDYPILKALNVVPFLHVTGALITERLKRENLKLKEITRLSAGMGVKFAIGGTNLELFYNIGHFGQRNDGLARFQILMCQ